MKRAIRLEVVTSSDGTKCAAECPRFHETPPDGCRAYHSGHWCDEFGAMYGERSPACIAAESAACEAEVDALQRGFDLRDQYCRGDALDALDGRIADVRGAS